SKLEMLLSLSQGSPVEQNPERPHGMGVWIRSIRVDSLFEITDGIGMVLAITRSQVLAPTQVGQKISRRFAFCCQRTRGKNRPQLGYDFRERLFTGANPYVP